VRRVPLILGSLATGALLLDCAGDPKEKTGSVSQANTAVCPPDVVEGIDVFDGQGQVDWAQVASSGRAFAIIKATQGDYNTQRTFPANWADSRAAHLLRAPYHFFDPTVDGTTQAQHFLTVLNSAGGLLSGDLPPVLDIECPTSSTESHANADCEGRGHSGWVPTATLTQRIFDWLSTVESETGRKAILYSYASWFSATGVLDARLAQHPLHVATLGTCASVPAPWTAATFWQYSITGTSAGISGNIDLDRFLGTYADLVEFANGPPPDGGETADAGQQPNAPVLSPIEPGAGEALDQSPSAPAATPPGPTLAASESCAVAFRADASPLPFCTGVAAALLASRIRRRRARA
jgi:GH25 family lysozyme M1 (1,4-beta-N-acetylmuramidase)